MPLYLCGLQDLTSGSSLSFLFCCTISQICKGTSRLDRLFNMAYQVFLFSFFFLLNRLGARVDMTLNRLSHGLSASGLTYSHSYLYVLKKKAT